VHADWYSPPSQVADSWDSNPANQSHVLVAMQQVDRFPVYVAVALHDSVYLAQWRHQAMTVAAFALGGCLFLALSFQSLVRMLRARELEMREQARLRDAAEQASRAKTQFLATISHEIRTPLNGILGTADLLAHSRLDAQQAEWTHTLMRSGKHLLGVISDVLDLSKIEAGEMTLAPTPVNPRSLAQEVRNLFVGTARGKGLQLVLDAAPDVPACVEADGTRLRQVLANLLSNAIKFSDRGEVRLVLTCASLDAQRCELRFEVRDEGVGMSPEAQLRVLAPFVQADGSVARRYGGTGLGLAICDRLLTLMGSHIQFESAPGQGSRFWFALDLRICTDSAQAHRPTTQDEADRFANSGAAPLDALPAGTSQPAMPLPSQPLGLHVLVVEDNPVNALVIEAQLGTMGCTCEIATDGQAALHALKARRFDAVLMDCMLPLMSGYDATTAWRSEEERLGHARVPIIALTANVMASNLQRCIACGMDDHLTKPCTRDALEATLRKWAM
jgi:signal transduction histidine kinase